MILFFCLRCSEISISDESLLCSHCENGESGTAVTDNLNLPEPENGSSGYNVPVINAGNQNPEEDFKLVEPTGEANTLVFEENSMAYDICNAATSLEVTDDTPAATQHIYICEESLVNEGKNKSNSDDFLLKQGTTEPTEHLVKADKLFSTDSITFYSEYPGMDLLPYCSGKIEDWQDKDNHHPSFSSCPRGNPSISKHFQENLVTAKTVRQQKPRTSKKLSKNIYEKSIRYFMKNKTTSQESTGNPQVASQQQICLWEQSSIGARKNEYDSGEFLRRQGTIEPAEPIKNIFKLDSTGLVTYESEYPILNIISDSFGNSEDRQQNILSCRSSLRQRNPSIKKRFQTHLVTAKTVRQQKPRTSKKVCEKCRRHFFKESTFYAHLKENCDPMKPYKCGQCGEIFPCISGLESHRRVHTGVKPFKCNQCGYASARPDSLKIHLKIHTKR